MATNFQVDEDVVRLLAKLLEEMDLAEIEIEDRGRRIRIAKGGRSPETTAMPTAAVPASVHPQPVEDVPEEPSGFPITSPMVGTAYLAPEPGAPAFVSVGDKVAENQTVLLIEAMKTYNPVRAPQSGVVLKILIDNATPVEFGEELMILG